MNEITNLRYLKRIFSKYDILCFYNFLAGFVLKLLDHNPILETLINTNENKGVVTVICLQLLIIINIIKFFNIIAIKNNYQ